MPELYPFQAHGRDFLVEKKRVLLAFEMGLGKTPTAIEALKIINTDEMRILIAAPKTAIGVWLAECEKWGFLQPVPIRGSPDKRSKLWRTNSGFYITTIQTLQRDILKPGMMPTMDVLIVDEAHSCKNRKTKNFKTAKNIAYHCEYVWELTGTPTSKGAQDLWALLNILRPKIFTSFWKFVYAYCHVTNGPFGLEIEGTKNISALRKMLSSHMVRAKKKDVMPELPPKTRQKLPVEMQPKQTKLYNALKDNLYAILTDGSFHVAQNMLVQLNDLRAVLVCPKIVDPDCDEYGAGLEAIKERIEVDGNQHIVIFTPYRRAIPYIREFFAINKYLDPMVIQGGMKFEDIKLVEEAFNSWDGPVVCSIKSAQSFSLYTSGYCYFLGCDFDPNVNDQAEARLHRAITKNAVNCYYVTHEGTVEESVVEVVNFKNRNINKFMRTSQGIMQILKGDLNDS